MQDGHQTNINNILNMIGPCQSSRLKTQGFTFRPRTLNTLSNEGPLASRTLDTKRVPMPAPVPDTRIHRQLFEGSALPRGGLRSAATSEWLSTFALIPVPARGSWLGFSSSKLSPSPANSEGACIAAPQPREAKLHTCLRHV